MEEVVSTQDERRACAVAQPTVPLGLEKQRELWSDLLNGRFMVIDSFVQVDSAYLVLQASITPVPLPGRFCHALDYMLIHGGQKAMCIDFGLATATVAMTCKQSLAAIGVQALPSKVPMALKLLALGASGRSRSGLLHQAIIRMKGIEYLALSAQTMGNSVLSMLSPAQQVVVHLRAEGRSHAEIAAFRRTSRRTVANQLADAFHRLGVSGRSGLLEYLALPAGTSASPGA